MRKMFWVYLDAMIREQNGNKMVICEAKITNTHIYIPLPWEISADDAILKPELGIPLPSWRLD